MDRLRSFLLELRIFFLNLRCLCGCKATMFRANVLVSVPTGGKSHPGRLIECCRCHRLVFFPGEGT